MSNKTQLQTNNTQLASLISTLQGKAAGGGGAAVETCSVRVYATDGATCLYQVQYTAFEDGKVVSKRVVNNEDYVLQNFDITYENVCCGTVFYVSGGAMSGVAWTLSGAEHATEYGGYDSRWFRVNVAAGETATIKMNDDD